MDYMRKNIMSELFCVGETDVIMRGLTTYPGYGMKSYIVYIKREKGKMKYTLIRILM